MLKRSGEFTEGSYILIRNLGKLGKKITNTYGIWPLSDIQREQPLGSITWFSRWRKYAFAPLPNTVYEETCLREIAQFIEEETKAQIAQAKVRRKTEKETEEAKRINAIQYIWVKCGDCKKRSKQEDGEFTGPRPCRRCGSTNTTETDAKLKVAGAYEEPTVCSVCGDPATQIAICCGYVRPMKYVCPKEACMNEHLDGCKYANGKRVD